MCLAMSIIRKIAQKFYPNSSHLNHSFIHSFIQRHRVVYSIHHQSIHSHLGPFCCSSVHFHIRRCPQPFTCQEDYRYVTLWTSGLRLFKLVLFIFDVDIKPFRIITSKNRITLFQVPPFLFFFQTLQLISNFFVFQRICCFTFQKRWCYYEL